MRTSSHPDPAHRQLSQPGHSSVHDGMTDFHTSDLLRLQPRLRGLAYRMLGDMEDAEEVVQEAYLRWQRGPRDDVRSPEAWLVTAVSRLGIDRLRKAATERATYIGPWLPSPVATPELLPSREPSPDRDAELASDLSVALLVLLERLAPEERAAFLLREVFGAEYAEIARILSRSEPAVRQVVSRAKKRVQAERARFAAPRDVQGEVLQRFLTALAAEDAAGVLAVLAPDVTWTSDGGGKVTAARKPIVGPERIVRALLAFERKGRGIGERRLATLNGRPGYVTLLHGQLLSATTIAVEDGRIVAFYSTFNPEKLRYVSGLVAEVE